jgi:MFS family permease
MAEFTRSQVIKVAIASTIGTTIEWYDFFLSATAAAIVWPYTHFYSKDPAIPLLSSLITFGIGFVSRPVGAIIFGHIGDKRGRKDTLVLTLIFMGIGTLGIGLTPPYFSTGFWPGIGIWAGVLLAIFRLLQGLAVGGEWGGASTIITEYAARSKFRAFWASWVQQGVPFGVIASNGAFLLLQQFYPPKDFLDWGWRIAYYVGAAVLVVGAIIRYKIFESPIFQRVLNQRKVERVPFVTLMKNQWKTVLLLAIGWTYNNATFYVSLSFGQAYLIALGFPRTFPQILNIIASIVGIFFILIGATIADKLGRKPIIILAALIAAAFQFPYFMMLNTKDVGIIILAASLANIGYLGYATYSAYFAEQFPAKYRYSGASFSYHLSTPLSGGLAPIIAGYIFSIYGANPLIAWPYIALMGVIYALISATAMAFTRETYKQELKD